MFRLSLFAFIGLTLLSNFDLAAAPKHSDFATNTTKSPLIKVDNDDDEFIVTTEHIPETGGAAGAAPQKRQRRGEYVKEGEASVEQAQIFNAYFLPPAFYEFLDEALSPQELLNLKASCKGANENIGRMILYKDPKKYANKQWVGGPPKGSFTNYLFSRDIDKLMDIKSSNRTDTLPKLSITREYRKFIYHVTQNVKVFPQRTVNFLDYIISSYDDLICGEFSKEFRNMKAECQGEAELLLLAFVLRHLPGCAEDLAKKKELVEQLGEHASQTHAQRLSLYGDSIRRARDAISPFADRLHHFQVAESTGFLTRHNRFWRNYINLILHLSQEALNIWKADQEQLDALKRSVDLGIDVVAKDGNNQPALFFRSISFLCYKLWKINKEEYTDYLKKGADFAIAGIDKYGSDYSDNTLAYYIEVFYDLWKVDNEEYGDLLERANTIINDIIEKHEEGYHFYVGILVKNLIIKYNRATSNQDLIPELQNALKFYDENIERAEGDVTIFTDFPEVIEKARALVVEQGYTHIDTSTSSPL